MFCYRWTEQGWLFSVPSLYVKLSFEAVGEAVASYLQHGSHQALCKDAKKAIFQKGNTVPLKSFGQEMSEDHTEIWKLAACPPVYTSEVIISMLRQGDMCRQDASFYLYTTAPEQSMVRPDVTGEIHTLYLLHSGHKIICVMLMDSE